MPGQKSNPPKKVVAPIFNFARNRKKAREVKDSFVNPIGVLTALCLTVVFYLTKIICWCWLLTILIFSNFTINSSPLQKSLFPPF